MTTMNSTLQVLILSVITIHIHGLTIDVRAMVECIRIDCDKIDQYPPTEVNTVMSKMAKQNYVKNPSRLARSVSRTMSSVENTIQCWKHLIECNLEKSQTLMAISLLERFGSLSIPEPGTAQYENFIVGIISG